MMVATQVSSSSEPSMNGHRHECAQRARRRGRHDHRHGCRGRHRGARPHGSPAPRSRPAQAVELAGRLRPDVVLMDLRLADGSFGGDAAREILARFGIRSIFVSGNLDPSTRDLLSELEPVAMISKPFVQHQLAQALEAAREVAKLKAPPHLADRTTVAPSDDSAAQEAEIAPPAAPDPSGDTRRERSRPAPANCRSRRSPPSPSSPCSGSSRPSPTDRCCSPRSPPRPSSSTAIPSTA